MHLLYNIAIHLYGLAIQTASLFNPKAALWVKGRAEGWKRIAAYGLPHAEVIWMHCASLGEFEQGRPLLETLRKRYPQKKIVLTFFSPSGYEVRKNYDQADVVEYLPLDTPANAQKWVEKVQPEIAIFIKYEFWSNYILELHKQQVKVMLVSGIFREQQRFFQFYGGWFRKILRQFDVFFVQDEPSEELVKKIGVNEVFVSGDTRFDRVFEVAQESKPLPFMEDFLQKDKVLIVAGSTWTKDEDLFFKWIAEASQATEVQLIIAPHHVDRKSVMRIKKSIEHSVLFSELKTVSAESNKVLIIDSIGLLSHLYKWANIAYVGGGFGAGIHNTLEPAVYGVPVVFGPNYAKFKEAQELLANGAAFTVSQYEEFKATLNALIENETMRKSAGEKSRSYVKENKGATQQIMHYIEGYYNSLNQDV